MTVMPTTPVSVPRPPSRPPRQKNRAARLALAAVLVLPFLYSGDDQPTRLQQVERRGTLTVLTRNAASSYYLGAEGPTGPEYELAAQFSAWLGVTLEIRTGDGLVELGDLLARNQGDLIAANLGRTARGAPRLSFGPDYLETEILVITRAGEAAPEEIGDLADLDVMVVAGSGYEEALAAARESVPNLRWEARPDVGIEELLLAVADGAIDATLVDSSIFRINRSFYPRLEVAFTMPGTLPHAWAFAPGPDDSLAAASRAFFLQAGEDGTVAAIFERYYTDSDRLGQFDMFHFLERIRERLPELIDAFQEAGNLHGVDWRLLAAVGYQESLWDPLAASRTGVRGIMMLTEQTAQQLGVDDRLDPDQSIEGGARYLKRLRDRLPARIPEPDRTWMALAAYNMGVGHLHDARVLTQKQGLNPDRWADVRQCLDLLSQPKWYAGTRHGFARGFEAREFVENIRRYFEILIWMDTREHPLLVTQAGASPGARAHLSSTGG